MQKRARFLSPFVFFLILSIIFYGVFQLKAGENVLSFLSLPIKPLMYLPGKVEAVTDGGPKTEVERLEEEVGNLRQEIATYKERDREIQALRDQFKETAVSPRSLLPAKIIGLRGFVPGIAVPDFITIDKGENDGVRVGQTVIIKNSVVGKINKVTKTMSLVSLVTNENESVTALTTDTNALGVVKGGGDGELILDNVLLSDSLKVGDMVVTKGSVDLEKDGVPPGLVIGRIRSVEKKPSALFQNAKLDSPVKITYVSDVFILQ